MMSASCLPYSTNPEPKKHLPLLILFLCDASIRHFTSSLRFFYSIFSMLLFPCIDPALGRLDYASLSDQARMEILVSGLDEASRKCVQDENGAIIDVCDWPSITCDDEGNVIRMKPQARFADRRGTLYLDYIPPKCVYFSISVRTNLTGTLTTSLLPQVLEVFACSNNKFFGTVDFTSLPSAMREFSIANNNFSGSCDLTKLPKGLTALEIGSNNFTGSLDLTALPLGLTDFDAGCNAFSGEIQLHKLPPTLVSLFIDGNSLTGKFSLVNPPDALEEVVASDNEFSGDAVMSHRIGFGVKLAGNNIDRVLDESGGVHADSVFILEFEENESD